VRPRRFAAAAAVLLALFLAPRAAPAELTERERAGRTIYLEGTSPSGGTITAIIGDTVLPGSALRCAGCHGTDGLGRAEGGVLPPEITWRGLAKPYGHDHGKRRHPAFDERSVARAISDGIDPAGNPLDGAMPRYSLSREDMESLVAYLKVLDREAEPGVSATAVRIGTVLPVRGRLASVGRALRSILDAYLAELNGRGGLHGRTVMLSVAEYDSDTETGAEALERLLAAQQVLALVSGFTPRSERDVAAVAEREGIPLIAPLTTSPHGEAQRTFYTLGGVREQARALAEYAARTVPAEGRRVAVLHPRGGALGSAADAAVAQLAGRGGRASARDFGPGDLADSAAALARDGTGVVLLLGSDSDVATLATAARAARWSPVLLVAGLLAPRGALEAAAAFREVRVAFPSAPTDGTAAGRRHFAQLAGDSALSPGERHAQAAAYVAAALLTEGLRRSGRQLSREALVSRLESLQRFAPGVGPPLSYGPSRRIGALGAYVLAPASDGSGFREAGGWVGLE
jgi:ABC-type branched-subunit amino acid transport system substrate-binding protein